VLLEGLPGLAKSLAVSTLAQTIHASFHRIQFTPDMLPADVIGTLIYQPDKGGFAVRKGPIFANFVLADEINRAPAKVQSALLESMQERQVTIGTQTYPLQEPFLVLATQNPIEQAGTYPLPEAQLDRFLLKIVVPYPSRDDEKEILRRMARTGARPEASPIVTPKQILDARKAMNEIYVDDRIHDYVVDLVGATREPGGCGLPDLQRLIACGGSPRASIGLVQAARGHAFLQERGYVTPQDVKTIAPEVLRHRVLLSYEAEADGIGVDELIHRILDHVPVP
jgi:MoxR-like ATPase